MDDRAAASNANAAALERALARSRAGLALVRDDAERTRHAQAIESLARYVGLLGANHETYPLKLELADGRWDVAESELASRPRLGDVLSLDSGRWSVRGTQLVRPSVPGKPAREFLVCSPA